MGFRDGSPRVVFPGNLRDTAIAARSTVALEGVEIGTQVALVFEKRRRRAPDDHRQDPPDRVGIAGAGAAGEGRRVTLTAGEEIELRVGQASIRMHADGRITVRGDPGS